MSVLVTGGMGYIGSHTVVELLNSGEEVVVIDDLSNSKEIVKDRIEKITGRTFKFYKINILDKEKVEVVFKENKIDLVVLAGYLKIISPKLVNEFRNKMINIHPSLIPSFCGAGFYGEKVHQGVIDYGAKVTGATVHFVDEGADTGPIIMQDVVKVNQDDDAKTLAKRVLEVEHRILKESISLFCENKIKLQGRRVFINE